MEGRGLTAVPSILHVGCGSRLLPEEFSSFGREVRLDIDPAVKPDVVASMTDLGEIGPFHMVYSSHCMEHLFPHEVGIALGEFLRVLKPGGAVVVIVPDLEGISPTNETVYDAACGPISGLDMYYGRAEFVEKSPFMAHRTGFVRGTLQSALELAGFVSVQVTRDPGFNLVAVGAKPV